MGGEGQGWRRGGGRGTGLEKGGGGGEGQGWRKGGGGGGETLREEAESGWEEYSGVRITSSSLTLPLDPTCKTFGPRLCRYCAWNNVIERGMKLVLFFLLLFVCLLACSSLNVE